MPLAAQPAARCDPHRPVRHSFCRVRRSVVTLVPGFAADAPCAGQHSARTASPAPHTSTPETSVQALSWRLLPPQLANDPLLRLQSALITRELRSVLRSP